MFGGFFYEIYRGSAIQTGLIDATVPSDQLRPELTFYTTNNILIVNVGARRSVVIGMP